MTRPAPRSRRDGGSLMLVIIVMLVLDCVILGTLHLAMLEHRLAANTQQALHLRLAAEAAAATALDPWLPRFDSLPAGAPLLLPVLAYPGGVHVTASVESLGPVLVMVRAVATPDAPRYGTASAARLFDRPLLPAGLDTPHAVERLLTAVTMLRDWPGVTVLDGDIRFEGRAAGVILATGALELAAGAALQGAIFAAGPVRIRDDASVSGVIVAPGIDGEYESSAGAAEAALAASGLTRATAARTRSRLPGF
jgi:hypothetical protein